MRSSSETNGKSRLRLMTWGQLIALFSFSWKIHALFRLAPLHFLGGNLNNLVYAWAKKTCFYNMVVIFIPPKNLFHLCALRLIKINKKKKTRKVQWVGQRSISVHGRLVGHWFLTTVYVRLAVSFDDAYTCIITLY